MSQIDKFLKRPKSEAVVQEGRYEKYNLRDNPFPAQPFVNPDSNDARFNGDIYEPSIREEEYELILENFIRVPQNDPNHLRLGYIMDTSYVGRGNGKSAFLVNLQKQINDDFGLSLSNEYNKCFSVVIKPEASGKTKTWDDFVDLLVANIFQSDLIDTCLATLRLEALFTIVENFDPSQHFGTEEELRNKLTSSEWYREHGINVRQVVKYTQSNTFLREVSPEFPIYWGNSPMARLSSQKDFQEYYIGLKRGKSRIEFLFSDLVSLFLASGFNGAYVFIDDFERIPDFQSSRQKRDFALALRTCLFDGMYVNARTGFYNFLFVLHAGVPSLIQEAWEQSGLEHRSPISFNQIPKHIIRFDKMDLNDTYSLIRKYLSYYRIRPENHSSLLPFQEEALAKIAELSVFNASKILKMAHEVLDRAARNDVSIIDLAFVQESEIGTEVEQKPLSGIHDAPTKNLMDEAD